MYYERFITFELSFIESHLWYHSEMANKINLTYKLGYVDFFLQMNDLMKNGDSGKNYNIDEMGSLEFTDNPYT